MVARNYRTSKGTELPLLNLRGKQYFEVKFRLVWFREDHPDWSIETELDEGKRIVNAPVQGRDRGLANQPKNENATYSETKSYSKR